MRNGIALAGAAALLSAVAHGETVHVEATGTVEWNQVTFGSLAAVDPGDPVVLTFAVDSENYVDSGSFSVRGYAIDHTSFLLTLGSVTEGLQDPFPGGETPYFVLRDNDPAVDGVFISTNVDWPVGVPINEVGNLDQFRSHLEVGYTGDTLSSLDILDALGTYDFTGLTNYYFTVNDGSFEPVGIEFTNLTISVEAPPCPWDCGEPADGEVTVVDFLSLLAQWNTHAGSCDFGLGQPRVGIEEFLALLAHWGTCP